MTLRVATVLALSAHVGLGAVSNLLFVAAFQFRPEWFLDPALVVSGGEASAELFKWAALTDLFSYYLPNAVVALALWIALRPRGPVLASVSTAAALGYVLVGGAGAAVLAMAGAPLIAEHSQDGTDPGAIRTAFGVLTDIVFRGIWQLLDGILLTIWFVGTGLLIRADQSGFGRLSLLLGGLIALGTNFNVLGFGLGRDLGMGLVFAIWAAWSVWLAVLVWRRRLPLDSLDAPARGDS
jgi:hypothetical protein